MSTQILKSMFFVTMFGLSCSTYAMTEAEYDAVVSQAKADYKAAAAQCRTLRGNEKDVCKKEANTKYTKAKTDAKAAYKGTAHAKAEAIEDQAEADYKVAKEK
jgi:hyperosmotically inducible periplasmic protein